MATRHGNIAHIGYGREATWGSAVSVDKFVESEGADFRIEFPQREIPDNIRGQFGRREYRNGGQRLTGTLRHNASGDRIGDWLLGVFGTAANSTIVNTGGLVAAYHKFTVVKSVDMPSWTFEEDRGGLICKIHPGICISRLSLDYPSGGILAVDLDLRGQGAAVSTGTASTGTFWADTFFDAQKLTVQIPSGTSDTRVEAWRLEFDQRLLDDIWCAGNSGCISKLPRGGWRVSGHIDVGYEVDSYYIDYLNAANKTLAFVFSGDAICTSPTGLSAYWLRLDLAKVKWMATDIPLGSNRMVQGLDLEALYDPTATYDVQAELVNTVQSYS